MVITISIYSIQLRVSSKSRVNFKYKNIPHYTVKWGCSNNKNITGLITHISYNSGRSKTVPYFNFGSVTN